MPFYILEYIKSKSHTIGYGQENEKETGFILHICDLKAFMQGNFLNNHVFFLKLSHPTQTYPQWKMIVWLEAYLITVQQ